MKGSYVGSMVPSDGMRLFVERCRSRADLYEGQIVLTDRAFSLRASIASPDGKVEVEWLDDLSASFSEGAASALSRAITQLIRSAIRAPYQEGKPLPRKIVRWRALP